MRRPSHAARARGNRVSAVAARDAARYGQSVLEPPYAALTAALLDLGNTLIGMDAVLVVEAMAAEGIVCTPERFRRAEAAARPALSAWMANPTSPGPVGLVYVAEILRCLEVDGDALRALVTPRLVARMRGVPTERLWSEVLPGVPDALARLRADGLRLVVVSNSDGTAEKGMVDCGLRALVDAVVDSAVFGAEKPDRRIFEHALALAGVEPGAAMHVGDLVAADVVGARAAGIHPVLLDPFGDWVEPPCATATSLGALAERVGSARR
jgi:putative hydrolase of the HAD superfamily